MTPWTAAHRLLCPPLSPSLLKFTCIESVMLSKHLILCCYFPLLLVIFPTIRILSSESVLRIRWPKYWNFSFSISPSNEYSGLISFRIDWFDLQAVQGTLKNLLQNHNLEGSVLQLSVFFTVQLSQLYGTTGKKHRFDYVDFVGKVMSLLFNMLSRFSIAFLPRRKHLLVSWVQSPSAVIFGAQGKKNCHCFHFLSFYWPWDDGYHDW